MNIELITKAIIVVGDIANEVIPYVEKANKGAAGEIKKELATRMVTSIYNASPAKDTVPFDNVAHIVSETIDSLVDFFHKSDDKFGKKATATQETTLQ